jgi:anti-sigma-K factor RskA
LNVQEYIESGVLEAYVLDALSAEERSRVEQEIAQYPELAAEVRAIEEGMYAMAKAGAQEPPAFMKEQIWNKLAAAEPNGKTITFDGLKGADNVRPFSPKEYNGQIGWQRAAVLIALVGSLLVNFLLWSERNKTEESRLAMEQQVDSLKQQQRTLAILVANNQKEKDMMADADMQPVVMKSMQPGHPMAATVYWSKDKGEAWLAVQKLPAPPEGMQYQMWVIQGGKPVSMGMIENDRLSNAEVSRLPMQVSNGEAFAISLEKTGGVPSPTVEQIQVLGKVPS